MTLDSNRRFSVDEYHKLLEAGVLQSGDPIELLEGFLVIKPKKLPSHSVATGLTKDTLDGIVSAHWFIRSQEPMTTRDSEPEPDAMVVRGHRRDYLDHHPTPADVALVVEVADGSLPRDRGPKKRLYARASVLEYWIVNLVDRQIEVFTAPSGSVDEPDYGEQGIFSEGDTIPFVIDGQEVAKIAVSQFLP